MSINKFVHNWSWILIVVFLVTGYFYPKIGIVALVCMLAPVVLSLFRGRKWCGVYCPRGSFLDKIISKIGKNKRITKAFSSNTTRISVLIIIMGIFTYQMINSWGDLNKIGFVFWRMIVITTLISIIMGVFYNHRSWCSVCPMGTLSKFVADKKMLSKKTKHVTFDKNACVDCKKCNKSCPMNINVQSYKDVGKVNNADCIKCNICVEACPKKSLDIA